jgi:hypothetical protein
MGARPVIRHTPPGAARTSIPADGQVQSWLSRPSIEVVPIRNPILEALGHHPTSDYGEQFWLPVIGPSALWAHRRLTAGFRNGQSSYRLDIATLGRELGLGAGTGRHSPVIRTLTRLVDFHLAEIIDGRLAVHTMLPPLTRRQAARLPEHLAARHQEQAALTEPRRSAGAPTRMGIATELDP